jgi:hypothetical protein
MRRASSRPFSSISGRSPTLTRARAYSGDDTIQGYRVSGVTEPNAGRWAGVTIRTPRGACHASPAHSECTASLRGVASGRSGHVLYDQCGRLVGVVVTDAEHPQPPVSAERDLVALTPAEREGPVSNACSSALELLVLRRGEGGITDSASVLNEGSRDLPGSPFERETSSQPG